MVVGAHTTSLFALFKCQFVVSYKGVCMQRTPLYLYSPPHIPPSLSSYLFNSQCVGLD